MGAFNDRLYPYLQGAITNLRGRMGAHNAPGFTHEEMLRLVCDDHTYDVLTSMRGIANIGIGASDMSFKWAINGVMDIAMNVALRGTSPPPTPKFPVPDRMRCPEVSARLDEWAARAYNNSRGAARARAVLNSLNEICDSPGVVRYLWPPVLALVRHAIDSNSALEDKLGAIANKIQEFKPPKVVPSLPMGLRDACRVSAAWVTSALMVGDSHNKTSRAVYIYTMRTGNFQDESGFTYSDDY